MVNIRNIKKTLDQYTYLWTGIILFSGKFRFKRYIEFKKHLKELNKQASHSKLDFPITKLTPCYQDRDENSGGLMLHYFFQDLFVAQLIFKNNPVRHVDIGSRVDGFVAHVASFREIEVFDIRPMDTFIPNVIHRQKDLMNVDDLEIGILDSVSCLHALEHFGLGRYSDPICFEGSMIGFHNITKMIKSGGMFYFSVPLGKQRIEFHAHRVFSLKQLMEMITPCFEIISFSYIDDSNKFYPKIKITDELIQTNCGCHYGCAVFELRKL